MSDNTHRHTVITQRLLLVHSMEEAETHSVGEDRLGVCVCVCVLSVMNQMCVFSLVHTEGELTLCYLLTPHQSVFGRVLPRQVLCVSF